VRAHERAQVEIAAYFGRDTSIDSAEEAYVILESQISVFAAAAVHASISRPVQRCIATAQETHRLYTLCRNYVLDAHAQGVLRSAEAEALVEPIAEAMSHLSLRLRRLGDDMQHGELPDSRPGLHDIEAVVIIQRAFRRWRMLRSIGVIAQASARHSRAR